MASQTLLQVVSQARAELGLAQSTAPEGVHVRDPNKQRRSQGRAA
jgi:hypothetical protein